VAQAMDDSVTQEVELLNNNKMGKLLKNCHEF
jgi:hypothetical protein